jgi:hypothetical protein
MSQQSFNSDGGFSTAGNITADYFVGNGSQLTGVASSYGNAEVANYLPTYTGTFGTLSALTVTGAMNFTGNLEITGNINATGNLNYDNVTDLVIGDPLIYIGANNTGNLFDLGMIVSYDDGLAQHGGWVRDASDGTWKLFGNVIPEPTTVINFTNAIYQPLQTGVITTTGLINGNANGVGNIGNSTGYFNTLFASATSAQYADLAEVYIADAEYMPGTVLSFGGTLEVTITTQDADPSIAGVVSTNPAYLMNAGVKSQYTAIVALVGQVPCKVKGNIRKGQMLVSAGDGYARAEIKPEMGTVIGKALEDFTGDQGIIKVVVGRL